MRAGENRGILSRVLTVYKQTFIFRIFHLFFFWKLKAPTLPCSFRSTLWQCLVVPWGRGRVLRPLPFPSHTERV